MHVQLPLLETPRIFKVFNDSSSIVLHLGDTHDFLQTIPSGIVKLIITSPPYNIGKKYETKKEIQDYLDHQDIVIDDLVRVLSEKGGICWQVGNYVESSEVFPLDIFYYHLFKKRGLKLRNRIIWHFEHGLHASKRLSGRYETILWFTKNDNYTFNLDAVRIPSKYPGKNTSRVRIKESLQEIRWGRTHPISGNFFYKNGINRFGIYQT